MKYESGRSADAFKDFIAENGGAQDAAKDEL